MENVRILDVFDGFSLFLYRIGEEEILQKNDYFELEGWDFGVGLFFKEVIEFPFSGGGSVGSVGGIALH